MPSSAQLQERLNYVQGCIQKSAIKSGRNPKHITLIAVTKAFPLEIWEQAIRVNLKTLGESRIQEAQEKVDTFNKRDKIELHLIGHLQSNKVRKAVELFDVIQTVDTIKLANRINSICKTQKITKAMKMVAASKMAGDLKRLRNGKNYGHNAIDMIFKSDLYMQRKAAVPSEGDSK